MEQVPGIIGGLVALALGACAGSFAVTVAYRLPREISIVRPGSFCESCQRPVPWWANIPIIAFLALRGRCLMCGAPIPARYLGTELLLALIALYLFVSFPLSEAAARFLFVTALVICSLVDYDWRLIPNVITFVGVPVGFVLATLVMPEVGWRSSLVGIIVGGGFLFLTGFIYQLVRGDEGVGLGDVFLVAMVGAFMGWGGVLFTLFFGALLGSVGGILVALFGTPIATPNPPGGAESVSATVPVRSAEGAAAAAVAQEDPGAAHEAASEKVSVLKTSVPFGPFLSLAAGVYAVFQPLLMNWYFSR
jgi:leader peptidase (prepilin peptidase) / N-methyltransferase